MRQIAMHVGLAIFATVICSQSYALRPKDDFFVHVKNETNHNLEICNSSLSFCKTLRDNDVFTDAQATEGEKEEFLKPWLSATKARICGKTVALKDIIILDKKRHERGAVVYTFNITKQGYENECGKP